MNAGRRPSARATCTTVMKVSAISVFLVHQWIELRPPLSKGIIAVHWQERRGAHTTRRGRAFCVASVTSHAHDIVMMYASDVLRKRKRSTSRSQKGNCFAWSSRNDAGDP